MPLQPNPLAGDDDGVAIDDRRRAGHVRLRDVAEREQGQHVRCRSVRSQHPVLRSGSIGAPRQREVIDIVR